MRRPALRPAVLTLAALSALVPGSVAAAAAAPPAGAAVALPITTAADVAAAGGNVFVSGGPGSTSIAVTAADGGDVRTIDGLAGPAGLLVSADGATVYAALADGDGIAAINARTARVRATWALGAGTCPSTLAQAGRWLYVGHGCGTRWVGRLGRFDLQRPRAGLVTDVLGESLYAPPLLDAGATTLAVGEPSLSPANVRSFRVAADGSLTQVSRTDHDPSEIGSNLRDLAVSWDGARVLTAAGAPYAIQEFATADLTTVLASHPTVPYPNAVATSPDDRSFAGGSDATYEADVHVFTGGAPARTAELGATLLAGGLTWSPNGRRVYAVTYDGFLGQPPTLHVLPAAG